MVGEEDLRAVLLHGADLPAAVLEGGVRIEAAEECVPVVARDRAACGEIGADRLGVGGRRFSGRRKEGGGRLRDDRLPGFRAERGEDRRVVAGLHRLEEGFGPVEDRGDGGVFFLWYGVRRRS